MRALFGMRVLIKRDQLSSWVQSKTFREKQLQYLHACGSSKQPRWRVSWSIYQLPTVTGLPVLPTDHVQTGRRLLVSCHGVRRFWRPLHPSSRRLASLAVARECTCTASTLQTHRGSRAASSPVPSSRMMYTRHSLRWLASSCRPCPRQAASPPLHHAWLRESAASLTCHQVESG